MSREAGGGGKKIRSRRKELYLQRAALNVDLKEMYSKNTDSSCGHKESEQIAKGKWGGELKNRRLG